MAMLNWLNLDGRNWNHTTVKINNSIPPPPAGGGGMEPPSFPLRGTLRERTLLRVYPTAVHGLPKHKVKWFPGKELHHPQDLAR